MVPPWTAKLRDWQARAVSGVLTHTRSDFLATATPAAGKTRFALRIAHQYLVDRVASRVLVICPTNHLRAQWSAAAGLVGIQLDPALTNEQAIEARDYHGAVVTYQQVCLAPKVFQRACRSRTTLLIFDELHHAGEGKDWGNALREAFDNRSFDWLYPAHPFAPITIRFRTCGTSMVKAWRISPMDMLKHSRERLSADSLSQLRGRTDVAVGGP